MKIIIMVILPILVFLVTGVSYTQTKGQVHLGLGSSVINFSTAAGNTGITGSLYNNFESGSDNSSGSSSFSFLVGYFPINNLRVDGGFSINAYENSDPLTYFNFGGRYFYYSNKKIMLNSGFTANFGLSNATERLAKDESGIYTGSYDENIKKPVNINISLFEFQYWPFEGGGLTADINYTFVFVNGGSDNNEKSYGLNVGLLIRLN